MLRSGSNAQRGSVFGAEHRQAAPDLIPLERELGVGYLLGQGNAVASAATTSESAV